MTHRPEAGTTPPRTRGHGTQPLTQNRSGRIANAEYHDAPCAGKHFGEIHSRRLFSSWVSGEGCGGSGSIGGVGEAEEGSGSLGPGHARGLPAPVSLVEHPEWAQEGAQPSAGDRAGAGA